MDDDYAIKKQNIEIKKNTKAINASQSLMTTRCYLQDKTSILKRLLFLFDFYITAYTYLCEFSYEIV